MKSLFASSCLALSAIFFPSKVFAQYIITGATTVCNGATVNYYINYDGCTPLSWSVAGGVLHTTTYNNAVYVVWNTVGSQIISVSSINTDPSCNDYINTSLGVSVLAIPSAPSLSKSSSNAELCSGESWTVTSNLSGYPTNYGYDWYATGGALINGTSSSSGSPVHTSTNSITVTPGTANGTCTVYGRLNNGNPCPSSYGSISFQVGPPVADINTLIYPSGQRGVNPVTLSASSTYLFQCDPVPGATSYSWSLPSGFSFYSGSSSASPYITTASASGSYNLYCLTINRCGSNWTHNLGITIGSGGGGGGGGCCPIAPKMTVYPNPSASYLTIEIMPDSTNQSTNQPHQMSIDIMDRLSRKVFSTQTSDARLEIPVAQWPSDIYYIHVHYGSYLVKEQIVVKH